MALGQSCDLLLNFLKYYQGPTYTSSTCKFLIVHRIMPLCANQYIYATNIYTLSKTFQSVSLFIDLLQNICAFS